MRQQTRPLKEPAEKVVQDIRRATRKHYSAEEKIRIVLEGLRGEDSIAELCRREGIAQNLYYRWSKGEPSAQKKRDGGWGGRRMRYPAAEKLEIIRLVEQSHLPVRRVLEQIGIPRSTFYRWCDLYQSGGPEALDDRSPRPDRVWNRIPDDVRARIVTLALDEPELSPRELAVRFTDAERYFVSEASVYRLLKAHDLITSPAF